jgi:hypothetical protein
MILPPELHLKYISMAHTDEQTVESQMAKEVSGQAGRQECWRADRQTGRDRQRQAETLRDRQRQSET